MEAQRQMQNVLADVNGAIRFIYEAEHKHPNRIDVCRQANGANAAAPSAFDQPSGLGPRPSALAAPAFGQPSQPQSTFGHPTQSTFGQPSQAVSTFGQPSQQPAAFGQPSQPQSTFGQPSRTASSFGQHQQPSFGQPSQPVSTFGQPSTLGVRPSPFSAPVFGQPLQPSVPNAAFGQPSALGATSNPFSTNNTVSPSPFAQLSQNVGGNGSGGVSANPFALATQQSNINQPNPFKLAQHDAVTKLPSFSALVGQPGGVGPQSQLSPGQRPTQFGQPSQSPAGMFGTTPAPAAQKPPAGGSGGPYAPGSTKQHPPIGQYSTRNPDGSLVTWKGKPVVYRDGKPGLQTFSGTWTRIWFPDGPPAYYKDTELPDDAYGADQRLQWDAFLKTGKFEGRMPDLPPKREFCVWDV